ncbi:unnamed protein product, partial [Polarella glacialis]
MTLVQCLPCCWQASKVLLHLYNSGRFRYYPKSQTSKVDSVLSVFVIAVGASRHEKTASSDDFFNDPPIRIIHLQSNNKKNCRQKPRINQSKQNSSHKYS